MVCPERALGGALQGKFRHLHAGLMQNARRRLVAMEERWTIRSIREAVAKGRLREPFSPPAVNKALCITYAGMFLPKHRVGNPGDNTEHFRQVSHRPALYRLR